MFSILIRWKVCRKQLSALFVLVLSFFSVQLFSAEAQITPAKDNGAIRRILAFGDSLTAGYGIASDAAYPALIQAKIDAQNLPYEVINAGVSGDTTAAALRRLNWVLRQPVDIMIVALGANDGLRGLDIPQAKENLRSILLKAKEKYPHVRFLLLGMKLPINMGHEYRERFEAIYPALAKEFDAPLVPFILKGVAGEPSLNLPDGLHPNEDGAKIVAENVWGELEKLLH